MKLLKLLVFLLVLLLAAPALGQDDKDVDPFFYIDGSTITITGIVAAVIEDQFTLDYGEGSITVEMDDGKGFLYEAEDVLVPGETVTVSGLINDKLFGRRSIEAGGVYIHEREVHYLSNMLDREVAEVFLPDPASEPSWMTVVGAVIDVDGNRLVVDTGARAPLTVGVGDLLDKLAGGPAGTEIYPGDQVRITGLLDPKLNGNVMEAYSITLEPNAYE